MSVVVSHALVSVFFAVAGVCVGFLVKSRMGGGSGGEASASNEQEGLAKQVLERVQGLTQRVVTDVNQHHTAIAAVDKELNNSSGKSEDVLRLVSRLVKANEDVQRKLAVAETKLDTLAQQIETHHVEARTDALTGCANRRAFDEEIETLFEDYRHSEAPFSMLMIDIDHFKQVNDTRGHHAGDEILRSVGRILRQQVRARDIVARYGGDEFVVLMPGLGMNQAKLGAEVIRETIERSVFPLGNETLYTSTSIGVSETMPYEDLSELIGRADQGLYAAKNAGRNRVYWHDGTLPHPVRDYNTEEYGPRLLKCAPENEVNPTPPPAPEPQTGLDVEVLKNIGTKTIFCQDVRRRIAEWQRGGPVLSVVLVEVDNLTEISRKFGTKAAETVLCAVATSLEDSVREMDLVARYAENVFGLLMPSASLKDAVCICERLRKGVSHTGVVVENETIPYAVSFGAVEVEDDDEMASLLDRARTELGADSSRRPTSEVS